MSRASDGLTVLIPDGESHFTLPVVTCLGSIRKTRVHVLSSDPNARVRFSRHCDSFAVVQPADEQARLRAVRQAIRCHRPDVLLPVCETGTRLLEHHAAELGPCVALPPFPDSVDIGDKWRLTQLLAKAGVPHPPTLLCTGDVAFRKRITTIPFPVLIKPRHLSGGAGIRAFSDPVSLVRFLEAHPRKTRRYVVQSVVPGSDLDVSVLCCEGRVLAHTAQRPRLEARGYRPATEIEMINLPEAETIVRQMVGALRWNGIANVDLRIDARDGRVSVIEVNPRYWSSLLGSHAAGVNFPYLACLAALGIAFDPPRQGRQRFLQARTSMTECLRALASGRLGALPGIGETIWPYLFADPLPHALGRMIARGARRPARPQRNHVVEAHAA